MNEKIKNSIQGYMYILECADKTYYTGSTKDLRRRIWEHENFLGANYTQYGKSVVSTSSTTKVFGH